MDPVEQEAALLGWLAIPSALEKALEGLEEKDLDLRGGPEGWSIRETAHHLVEANLVASNMMIAGLARTGCIYDWSWVNPDAAWMGHVGYTTAPVRPAIAMLRALSEHIAGLIRASPDGLLREVQILDAPGAKPYRKTVGELLAQENEHAEGHIREVAEIRRAARRS